MGVGVGMGAGLGACRSFRGRKRAKTGPERHRGLHGRRPLSSRPAGRREWRRRRHPRHCSTSHWPALIDATALASARFLAAGASPRFLVPSMLYDDMDAPDVEVGREPLRTVEPVDAWNGSSIASAAPAVARARAARRRGWGGWWGSLEGEWGRRGPGRAPPARALPRPRPPATPLGLRAGAGGRRGRGTRRRPPARAGGAARGRPDPIEGGCPRLARGAREPPRPPAAGARCADSPPCRRRSHRKPPGRGTRGGRPARARRRAGGRPRSARA